MRFSFTGTPKAPSFSRRVEVRRPVGEDDEVSAPVAYVDRPLDGPDGVPAARVHCDRAVSHLPAVAVGAMVDATPPELPEARRLGQLVHDAEIGRAHV